MRCLSCDLCLDKKQANLTLIMCGRVIAAIKPIVVVLLMYDVAVLARCAKSEDKDFTRRHHAQAHSACQEC